MDLRLKLLVIGVFLLSFLGFSRAKSPTVEVVGAMHCTDCIKNRSSNSNSSLGFEVQITCNANEIRTRGNGGVDEHGRFNVTLSAETAEDSGDADGCYAKLQSRSGAPCHIQEAQTASVKIISNSSINITRPTTVIKFSPITCQSAFFWHFPNLTFFGSSPPSPPEYTPPPLPPVASPAQPLFPPPESLAPPPQPSYDPPAPSLPPPVVEAPSVPPPSQPPAPPPTYRNPKNPRIGSPSPTPLPSSRVYRRRSPPPLPAAPPSLNGPIQSPIQTPNPTPPPTVIAPIPPTPAPSSPPAPAPATGISITPRRRRPSPIPKAPPIPRLPLTPSVPRKYFNPPKSRSKPPRAV